MKKNMADEQLLEKLCEACIDIENTPEIEDTEFKQRFLNEVSKNKTYNIKRRRWIFAFVNSALAIIMLVTCLFLLIPRETKRYSDLDDDIIISNIAVEEFSANVPIDTPNLIEIDTENISSIRIFYANNSVLACRIDYVDETYIFVTFTKKFIYSENDKFNTQSTVITNFENYSLYETQLETRSGRKTIIEYYLWVQTNTYDYFINIKNSNETKQNMFKEKILENM